MAGADIRRYSSDERNWALNFANGQAAALLAGFANAALHPTIVLPVFIIGLTNSAYAIAAVPVIASAGWLISWMIVRQIRSVRRMLPWLIGASLLRLATVVLLAFVIDRLGLTSTTQLLQGFLICFGAYTLASSLSAGLTSTVAARMISPSQRSRFYRMAAVVGASGAVIAGLLITRLLSDDGPRFPDDVALLFVLTAICLTAASYFEFRIREPSRSAAAIGPRPPVQGASNPGVTRYLTFRWLLAGSALLDPFLVVFAIRELGASNSDAGWFITAYAVARGLSAVGWSGWYRRGGLKPAMQAIAVMRLLVPVIALTLPFLTQQSVWSDRVTDPAAAVWVFSLTFALLGGIHSGLGTLSVPYAAQLSVATGANVLRSPNVVLAAAGLSPFAGAWLLSQYDFERVFLVAAVISLVAVFASGALTPAAVPSRSMAGAWRVRRANK